jgi:hypothetical protein
MTTETLKLALEALETADEVGFWELQKNAVIALRTAIAEAEKQEPVAWAEEIIEDLNALFDTEMIKEIDSGDALIRLDAAICAVEEAEERHTTPPAAQRQWVGLTEEEIMQTWEGVIKYAPGEVRLKDFARAIEAAHGITGEKT